MLLDGLPATGAAALPAPPPAPAPGDNGGDAGAAANGAAGAGAGAGSAKRLRCIDPEHAPTCTACRPPPTPAEEMAFEARARARGAGPCGWGSLTHAPPPQLAGDSACPLRPRAGPPPRVAWCWGAAAAAGERLAA